MIYIENDEMEYCSLFKVDKVGGHYYGWSKISPAGWEGDYYKLYPNGRGYTQAFLAPSILDRWIE